MGRAPCCDKANVKKGPWSLEEDKQLKEYIEKHGTGGNWIALPHKAGLKRCGKSCRLRWLNYLRPNIKHGDFSDDEDRIICNLYSSIGSRWSIIAAQLPGRTDNDIKNYWNTKLKKKLLGIPPSQRKPPSQQQHSKHHHQQQLYPSLQHATTNAAAAAPFPYPPGLEGIPIPPYLLSSLLNSSPSPLNPKGPTHQTGGNIIMFGGGEQSCSSSDASSTHISYGRDMDRDLYNAAGEQMTAFGTFDNYLYSGLEETQKQLLGSSAPGCDQTPFLFNYEEVKPHIGASNGNNNISSGCSSLFLEDQGSALKIDFKTPSGRAMYYC